MPFLQVALIAVLAVPGFFYLAFCAMALDDLFGLLDTAPMRSWWQLPLEVVLYIGAFIVALFYGPVLLYRALRPNSHTHFTEQW